MDENVPSRLAAKLWQISLGGVDIWPVHVMLADVTYDQSLRVGIDSKNPSWAIGYVEVETKGTEAVRHILPSHNKWMREGHDAVDHHGKALMCAS